MNIKRAFIGLTALMLLPAVAFAQIPVTPAEGTAVIMVQKIFTDGNDETAVTITLECTTGTIAPSAVQVFPDDGVEHAFVISEIPSGPDNICTVTESGISGYDTEAICADLAGGAEPDDDCRPPTSEMSYCLFNDVDAGDVGRCQLFNTPHPVEVEVTKVWDIVNTGGDYTELDAKIIVGCDAEMYPYDWTKGEGKSKKYYKKFYLSEGDFTDGVATVTVEVIPEYPTSECFAVEKHVDSAVEVESTCGSWNDGTMEVAVDQDASCTITNTLFFEGIPTLNQYGMAIMALLMLGVGFVGFRRFV